jgi:archaeoflavoprotein AfpA
MGDRVAWAFTGAGDCLPESVAVLRRLVQELRFRVDVFTSRAGLHVLKHYKLLPDVAAIATKILEEQDANTPFIAGALQKGTYRFLVVMPATANTVAKIVHGIADTLVTNAVAQAAKRDVPIYIYPVDQRPGTLTTLLPSGEKLQLKTRPIDLANVEILRAMPGITVLSHPDQLLELVKPTHTPSAL